MQIDVCQLAPGLEACRTVVEGSKCRINPHRKQLQLGAAPTSHRSFVVNGRALSVGWMSIRHDYILWRHRPPHTFEELG